MQPHAVPESLQNCIPHSKPWMTEADERAVKSVLQSGLLASGSKCYSFEVAFAKFLGMEPDAAISVQSGATGIILALQVLGVTHGDEVILPVYVCESVRKSILSLGATPILCDVGDYWVMTMETVAAALTPKTKAIIVPHIYGIPADIQAIQTLKIPVIEDCCQALGTINREGGYVGSQGDLGVFSFHPTKCMTTGEGGMVVTKSSEFEERLHQYRTSDPRFRPLNDMQAALGLSQLSRYPEALERRRGIAEQYFQRLPQAWTAPLQRFSEETNFFRFPLWINISFEEAQAYCQLRHIALRRGVDILLRYSEPSDRHFPNAERAFQHTVSLPIYPSLTDSEVEVIIQCLLEISLTKKETKVCPL